jgi:riboflavin kinase / FMN adenylyltransferase
MTAMPDRPALPHVWCDGAAPEDFGPSVVSIGVFDGVHRGHRVVVGRAAAAGERLGLPLVVVTFDPNPAEVVAGVTAPTRLCSVPVRAGLLVEVGADGVWVVPFTPELSRMTPEVFVSMLVAHVAPAAVVVGADFRFGHRASGDVDTLTELGQRYGFTVEAVQMQGRDDDRRPGGAWSSSAVRGLLADGDVQGAAEVLARPHRVEGAVVHGDHRGRELGFPTANLDVDPRAAVPADGVYAGWLVRESGDRLPAAVSVGTNPTFDGLTRRVEAYVLDAAPDLDLYGERVGLDFVARLRGMERFDSVPDLVAQMGRDVDQARAVLVPA